MAVSTAEHRTHTLLSLILSLIAIWSMNPKAVGRILRAEMIADLSGWN